MKADRFRFRAWDRKLKYMRDWKNLNDISYTQNKLNGTAIHDNVFNDTDFIVMQSTGLKDLKGKEVFEFDIVKSLSRVLPFIVKWENGAYRMHTILSKPRGTFERGIFNKFEARECEIIGNKFENKKLLVGKR